MDQSKIIAAAVDAALARHEFERLADDARLATVVQPALDQLKAAEKALDDLLVEAGLLVEDNQ